MQMKLSAVGSSYIKGSHCSDSLAYLSNNCVRSHVDLQRTARSRTTHRRAASLAGCIHSCFVLHRLDFYLIVVITFFV
jgi:hypothetical protein